MGEKSDATKKSDSQSVTTNDLTVADLLSKRRKELELSLKEVETATKIRKRYLEHIESSDYEHLADDVYTLGYVKSYADYLGFDTAPVVNMYKKERMSYKQNREAGDVLHQDNQMSLRPIGKQSFVLSSKSLLVLFSVVLFIFIIAYLGWQVAVLASPPKITLNDNPDKVTTSFVVISGQTDGDADVLIDNSPILTNSDGSFSERVALVNGSNQIQVTAKNHLGKSTTISRAISADLSQANNANAQLSNTPVAGVEMQVSITNQATWVIVITDGQDAFRGIMLPGTTRVFKAKDTIKLTTGNAGNTQVSITNSVAVNKILGTIGRQGEAKNNLEFNKDTQFQ